MSLLCAGDSLRLVSEPVEAAEVADLILTPVYIRAIASLLLHAPGKPVSKRLHGVV